MKTELRNLLQEKIIQIAKSNFYNGVIRASIRCGKTFIGLMCINTSQRTLVCYPKLSIKKVWEDEIEKHQIDVKPEYSSFASLKKLVKQGEKYDRILVDEIHKLSPKNRTQVKSLLGGVGGRGILGLTGTLRLKSQRALEAMGIPVICEYDIEDAIQDGLVKDYKLFIHFINMNLIDKTTYDVYSQKIDYFQKKEENELSTLEEKKQSLLGFKKYRGLRTNLIYNCKDLTTKAQELIEKFKDRKTLIFSLRTEVSDELSTKTYHSKNKDIEALEEFKLSENGHLSTVNMISEGITINNLNTIVCHTITSNTEDFQQKLGRGLQLGEVNSEVCEVHCICLKDTIQERWLELACKSLSQHKIFYNFEDGSCISKIEYLKGQHFDKELFFYKGSYCYPSSVNEMGFQMYKFLGDSDKEYSLQFKKLTKL